MEKLLHDIRYSIRMLRKSPGFTAIAIIALALGIGATTAIFSVIYAVALRPLPFKDPDRLVKVWGKFEKDGIPKNWISEPELYDMRENTQSFEDFAAFQTFGVNLTGGDSAEPWPYITRRRRQGRTRPRRARKQRVVETTLCR